MAIAIFVLSRHQLFLGAEAAENLMATVNIPFVTFFLFCFLVFLFFQLRYQTGIELTAITSHVGKLRRTVGQIEGLETRIRRLVGQAQGAMLTDRLDVWTKAVEQATIMPTREDAEILEGLRGQLHEIDIAAMRLQLATPTTEKKNEDTRKKQTGKNGETAAEMDQMNELARIGHDFEKRAQALELAIETSNSVLKDARTVFSNDDGSTAKVLAAELSGSLEEIKQIKEIVQKASRNHLRQRVFFGVTLPFLASLALLLLSADAIIAGGIQASRAISSAFV